MIDHHVSYPGTVPYRPTPECADPGLGAVWLPGYEFGFPDLLGCKLGLIPKGSEDVIWVFVEFAFGLIGYDDHTVVFVGPGFEISKDGDKFQESVSLLSDGHSGKGREDRESD